MKQLLKCFLYTFVILYLAAVFASFDVLWFLNVTKLERGMFIASVLIIGTCARLLELALTPINKRK